MDRRTFLSSLISSLIGFSLGLFTPWIQWIIDKKRSQQAYRIDMVKQWRTGIEGIEDSLWERMGLPCGDTAWYSSLRIHMNKEGINKVEYNNEDRTLVVGYCRTGYRIKQALLDEVARIEKEWGLN